MQASVGQSQEGDRMGAHITAPEIRAAIPPLCSWHLIQNHSQVSVPI